MKIDKQYGDVAFNEEFHKYWDVRKSDRKFISVTTIIEEYANKFDDVFWSRYKALERVRPKEFSLMKSDMLRSHKIHVDLFGITEDELDAEVEKVRSEWKEENLKSTTRGTAIHADKENGMYEAIGKGEMPLKKYGIGGKFECIRNHSEMNLENGIYPEYLISMDHTYKGVTVSIAGQIDLLIKEGNTIHIFDYKTNKKLDTKGFFDFKKNTTQKMLPPLGKLEDCNMSHYNLQLSLYMYMMLKANSGFKAGMLRIVHYSHDGEVNEYPLDYLEKDVVNLLNDYCRKVAKKDNDKKYEVIKF